MKWNDTVKKLMGNKNNLLILILGGVLLLVIALPIRNEKDSGSTVQSPLPEQTSTGATNTKAAPVNTEDAVEYAACMEEKLEEALSQVSGAGKVKVVISMKSSEEKIVEKDQPITRSNTSEEDSQGGIRNINNVESGESTVYSGTGTESDPFVTKVLQPQVEGVLVVAEGAGTGSVSKNMSEAVQVLFGVEAHKVKVVKMQSP